MKTNRINLFKKLAAVLALPVISILFNPQAHAAAFTAGDIAVLQEGDGVSTLSSTSAPIAVLEYTPAGSLVQTLSIPSTGGSRLTQAGNSATEGYIFRTENMSNLTFAGYDAGAGTASISGTTGGTVKRCVGQLDFNGNFTRYLSGSSTAYSGSNIRSSASDGTNYWMGGTASSTANGGVWCLTNGATVANQVVGGNFRVVRIFNGNLYYSLSSTTAGLSGVYAFSGLPTNSATASQIISITTGSGTVSPYDFAINPNGTVAYVNDDRTLAAGGGIQKWTFNGSTWSQKLTFGSANGLTAGGRALAVDFSGANPVIYATTADSPTELITITDTSAFAATSDTTDQATILATAPANTAFRGVALAPNTPSVPQVPTITDIEPSSVATNAGNTVVFTLSGNPGVPVASNFWYKIAGGSTNLVSGATTTILTLNNVSAADTASYFAILTNASGSATSSVVSLTVIDPAITVQPASPVFGLLDGTVQVSVSAAGTGVTYQWYQYDGTSIYTSLNNGSQTDGSGVFGSDTSTLTLTNLQFADATNLVVVVTGTYGAVTSSIVSLTVSSSATLAFWNLNQLNFPSTLNNPAPWFGVGTASATNCVTALGTTSADPSDGPGFGLGSTNYSWATENYPTNGNVANNKTAGVQFKVSTVGAKNIAVSYDSRVSATASDYERLQYTTNGTDWIDYPASQTFGGVSGTGMGGWISFSYSLVGFPGVANNPNFGVRVVTEFQSTATYGVGVGGVISNSFVAANGNYNNTQGTVTYDLVAISGDAITNNNTPPTISSFTDTNTQDNVPITLGFTVGDAETDPSLLTVSATALNPSKVNPGFSYGGSGASRTLTITPNAIADSIDAGPILVTVTDGNGDSTVTSFILTLASQNLPPTNSLTSLSATNTLANAPITIPFTVGDDRTPVSDLTYSVASDNNTLIPSDNIVVNGQGTANPTVTITPASNQLGVAKISVTVNDQDTFEVKQTTANIAFMVRPNTNIVAIDYFDYDSSGALDSVSGGFWSHLSGPLGQMQVSSDVVTVDTLDNSENVQTPLLGSPYVTNNPAVPVLYSSFIINLNPDFESTEMPIGNGTYFALFNDGSGVTGNYECRILAATNGAAPGFYRIGVTSFGSSAATGTMFPQDLSPGSNYVVVVSLVLSNGLPTLWVNPTSQSSVSVIDITANNGANLFNISAFELRQSGGNGGLLDISQLKIGTTFDSVFPSLHIQSIGTNAVVNWSDPTLGIQSTTNLLTPFSDVSGAAPPYTNNASTNTMMFFRLGQ